MNTLRSVHVACVAPLLLLAAGGCQGVTDLRDIEPPSARVSRVELVETTDEGAVVRVLVDLENPNRLALPLVASRYTLTVGERYTYSVTERPNRTLPSLSTQTLDLPAAFATGGADLAGAPYRVSGTIEYQAPGPLRRIMTDSGIPLPSVPYSATGTLQ